MKKPWQLEASVQLTPVKVDLQVKLAKCRPDP
jgi:hypothetical protein